MRVEQVIAAAAPRDAVTNHALALDEAFSRVGRSRVLARHVDPTLAERVAVLDDSVVDEDAVVVFHASIGEPAVTSAVREHPGVVVVVYHNITPPEFFEPYDPAFAARLEAGRDELASLASKAAVAIGDSAYNAAELRDLGFGDVRVVPLAVDSGRLGSGPPEPPPGDRPMFLFVGQLLPHKRLEFLIGSFHILVTYLVPQARLVVAGASRLPAYETAMRQFVAELALPGVELAGSLSDAELGRLYRTSTAFVTASEHEGFCAPLVEAMASGLPVIARDHAAIPETVAGAGIVLGRPAGQAVMAEALHAVSSDPALADDLRAAGYRRAAELSGADAVASLVEIVSQAAT